MLVAFHNARLDRVTDRRGAIAERGIAEVEAADALGQINRTLLVFNLLPALPLGEYCGRVGATRMIEAQRRTER